jgi:hypothetical protein
MPNPVINRRSGGIFRCPPMLTGGLLLDTVESYTNAAPVNGAKGGSGWCKLSSYTDRTNYLGIRGLDDMESYVNGTSIVLQNGGTGWAGGYIGDNASVSIPPTRTIIFGQTGMIAGSVTGGASPFTYQWFRNGAPLSDGGDISGAASATLSIANWQNFYDGNFSLQVTDVASRTFNSNTCAAAGESTSAWGAQVQANGGALPSGASMNAVNEFLDGLSQDGTTSLIIAACVFAPDSLIAMATPVIANAGNVLWTNHNFVLGDLTVNGLTGDGATKYLDTGIIPNATALVTTEGCLAAYAYNANTAAVGVEIGASSGSAGTDLLLVTNLNGFGFQTFVDIYNASGGRVALATPGNGFYIGSRTASNAMSVYFANSGTAWSAVGSTGGDGSGLAGAGMKIFVFADGRNNSAQSFCNSTLSFSLVAHGLTSAQGQAIYNRVQTLRTAFGGGFR